uniref:Uncharacterized protein n=1 Tax=Oryza punctata TaxID=4537 RepID=A0A0E0MN55_ORYPU
MAAVAAVEEIWAFNYWKILLNPGEVHDLELKTQAIQGAIASLCSDSPFAHVSSVFLPFCYLVLKPVPLFENLQPQYYVKIV